MKNLSTNKKLSQILRFLWCDGNHNADDIKVMTIKEKCSSKKSKLKMEDFTRVNTELSYHGVRIGQRCLRDVTENHYITVSQWSLVDKLE